MLEPKDLRYMPGGDAYTREEFDQLRALISNALDYEDLCYGLGIDPENGKDYKGGSQ